MEDSNEKAQQSNQRLPTQLAKRIMMHLNLNNLVFGKRNRSADQPTHGQSYNETSSTANKVPLIRQEQSTVCQERDNQGLNEVKISSSSYRQIMNNGTEGQNLEGRLELQSKIEDTARKNKSDDRRERKKKVLAMKRLRQFECSLNEDDESYEVRRPRKVIRRRGANSRPELNRIFRKEGLNRAIDYPELTLKGNLDNFSFGSLVKKFGQFDIMIIDEFVSRVAHLDLFKLVKEGLLFVWATHQQVHLGYQLLNRWNFQVIDQLVWVQITGDQLDFAQSNFLARSSCQCLVGFKNVSGKYLEYKTKISNNLIFSDKQEGTPREIYEIADLMMPGSRKINIFNRRSLPGWFCLQHEPSETPQIKLEQLEQNCFACGITCIQYRSFECQSCHKAVCQSCLFLQKQHAEEHEWRMRCTNKQLEQQKQQQCFICQDKIDVRDPYYVCQNCSGVSVCQQCFEEKRSHQQKTHCHDDTHNLTLLF